MVCTTTETAYDVGAVKHVKAPSNSFLTVRRRELCCGSLLPVSGVRVSMAFLVILRVFFLFLVLFGILSGHLLGHSFSLD